MPMTRFDPDTQAMAALSALEGLLQLLLAKGLLSNEEVREVYLSRAAAWDAPGGTPSDTSPVAALLRLMAGSAISSGSPPSE